MTDQTSETQTEDELTEHEAEVIDEEQEQSQALVAAPTHPQAQLALAGINAETLRKYLYSFNNFRGEEVVDVTGDGINHIAQAAGVSSDDVEIIHEDYDSITVKATAINQAGTRHIGIIREDKVNKNGQTNQYALQNAVSKAQRNAKKGLLPMTWIRDLIKEAVGEHVKTVDDLENRLDSARDFYRDHKETIQQQKEEIEDLRARLAQYEDTDESEDN